MPWVAPRLLKEARPLLWPWVIAALASPAALYTSDEMGSNIRVILLCASVALLAALPFGAEFQQRTLPLLLSQPLERWRLWREKFSVLAFGGAALLVLNAGTWCWLGHFEFWDLLFLWLVLLAIVTSSGFWISTTRSVPLGIVCGLVNQLLVFGGFILLLRWLHEKSPALLASLFTEFRRAGVFTALGLYALSFVWFGRRFWKGNLVALALVPAVIALMLCLTHILAGLASDTISIPSNALFEALFLLVTLCSAAYWTLTARSTIGGLVFCIFSQVLAGMLLAFVVTKVSGLRHPTTLADNGEAVGVALGVGALAYSGLFLWLGWRKFARMELRDTIFGEGIELPLVAERGRWWSRWLVSRPHGNLRNLLRKELRLQKPVFLSAVVFTVCWLVGFGLHQLWPAQDYRIFLELLPWFYIPLALILAGCVSATEEKTLGLATWHLTLPTSVRRMWLAKLGVANLTGFALGVVLPSLLLVLAMAVDASPESGGGADEARIGALLLLAWLTILVSFWASTLVSNVVRAALTTLLGLVVAGGCAALGIWAAATISRAFGGLETGLLTWLVTHWQLAPATLGQKLTPVVPFVLGAVAGLWVIVLLRQSLAQFRQVSARRATVLKNAVLLGALICIYGFWGRDLVASVDRAWAEPERELEQAIMQLPYKHAFVGAPPYVLSIAELESTGALSNNTKAWLRGAVVSCGPAEIAISSQNAMRLYGERYGRTCFVSVRFPNGGAYAFGFSVAPSFFR